MYTTDTINSETRSVSAGFGRPGMPPPASNDTGTAFCFRNKEEAEMKRTDDVSLWPWSLTLKLVRNVERVLEYPPGDTTTIRFRFMGYWAWTRVDQMLVGGAGRHRCRSIGYSSKCCCLESRNWQITVFFGEKILDLESEFRKLSSVIMLRSLIRILRASLVQIDTENAEKYANVTPTTTTSGMR